MTLCRLSRSSWSLLASCSFLLTGRLPLFGQHAACLIARTPTYFHRHRYSLVAALLYSTHAAEAELRLSVTSLHAYACSGLLMRAAALANRRAAPAAAAAEAIRCMGDMGHDATRGHDDMHAATPRATPRRHFSSIYLTRGPRYADMASAIWRRAGIADIISTLVGRLRHYAFWRMHIDA